MEPNYPTEPLDEWDLERNPVQLTPICDLCGEDASHGQSTAESVICHTCLNK